MSVFSSAHQNEHRSWTAVRLLLYGERANFDVAEGDFAVVPLKRESAVSRFREARHCPEFAFGNTGVEVVAADHVLDVLDAVDLMETAIGADDHAQVIPLPGRTGRIKGFAGFCPRSRR